MKELEVYYIRRRPKGNGEWGVGKPNKEERKGGRRREGNGIRRMR